NHPGEWRDTLRHLQDASAEGLQITGQVLPRPTGALLGLSLSLHPFALNPSFRAIATLSPAAQAEAMRDPLMRKRLLDEHPDDPNEFFRFIVSDPEALFVLGDPPNYHPAASDSIAAR